MTRDEMVALETWHEGPDVLVALDGLQDENPKAQAMSAKILVLWIDEHVAAIGIRRTEANVRRYGRLVDSWERVRSHNRIRINHDAVALIYAVLSEAAQRLRAGRAWRRQSADGMRSVKRLIARLGSGLVAEDYIQLCLLLDEAEEDGVKDFRTAGRVRGAA